MTDMAIQNAVCECRSLSNEPTSFEKFIPKKLVMTVMGSATTVMIVSVFTIWFR